MAHTSPIPPDNPGSPTIWQHVDRAEKAAKTATLLAAVAFLIGVIALVLALVAVFDDDERGDNQDDSVSQLRTHAVWVE